MDRVRAYLRCEQIGSEPRFAGSGSTARRFLHKAGWTGTLTLLDDSLEEFKKGRRFLKTAVSILGEGGVMWDLLSTHFGIVFRALLK